MQTLEQVKEEFPVDTPVKYFSVAGSPNFIYTSIRSEPWALGNGAIVIKVDGVRGGVLATPEHLQNY